MYQKTAQQQAPHGDGGGNAGAGGASGNADSSKKEDEVIDAEYVDMDKNE
jgi:nanoRNase/pAp phosphatase (c-di-AMP/oligoRNAs hydrolase)